MSSTDKYKIALKDFGTLKATLEKRGVSYRENCRVQQWSANNAFDAAVAFKLPGWKFEIGVTKEGDLMYDRWGSELKATSIEELVVDYNETAITEKAWGFANNVYSQYNEENEKQLVIEC